MALDEAKPGKGAKRPVSAHPAFPFVVALWFAALLGFGSLILPVQLLERLSVASGLASIVPPAAPPLGFTARILIAMAATLGGAVLGFVIARLALREKKSDPVRRMALNAHEELGEEGLDPSRNEHRRRSLALADDGDQRSEFLPTVPVPGARDEDEADDLPEAVADSAPQIVAHEAIAQVETSAEDGDGVAEDEPFELEESSAFTEAEEVGGDMDAPEAEPEIEEHGMDERQVFKPVGEFSGVAAEEDPRDGGGDASADAELADDAADEDAHDLASLKNEEPDFSAPESAEPLPFSPPSLAAGEEVNEDIASVGQPEPQAQPALEELGMMQLVQRLSASLEKHRAAKAGLAAAQPVPEDDAQEEEPQAFARVVPGQFDVAKPDEAAMAMAAYFAKPEAEEAGQQDESAPQDTADEPAEREETDEVEVGVATESRPDGRYGSFSGIAALGADDGDDDDHEELNALAASFTLPLGKRVQMAAAAKAAAQEDGDEPAGESESEPESAPVGPRAFAPPAEVSEASEPAEADDAEDEALASETGISDQGEEEDADEGENFSSLVGLQNPFKDQGEQFVRVDEPEPETPESSVVFPSERIAKPAAAPVQEAPSGRMFDPPAAASGSAPRAAPESAPRNPVSSEENERALREALMNLQRMGKTG